MTLKINRNDCILAWRLRRNGFTDSQIAARLAIATHRVQRMVEMGQRYMEPVGVPEDVQ